MRHHTIHTLIGLTEQITESGCWIFHGHLNSDGYSVVRFNGRNRRVHRVIYEYFNGAIPPGLTLDHLCRVRCCVNPYHVEPVTSAVNALRGIGITAQYARSLTCKNGHPFDRTIITGVNDGLIRPLGRRCSICINASQRRYKQRKKEKEA